MNALTQTLTLQSAVDQLGHLKAQIATLEAQEKKLRDALVASGEYAVTGFVFDATVSRGTVTTVPTADMKAYIGRTPAGKRWLVAHEQTAERITVKVVARTAPREVAA